MISSTILKNSDQLLIKRNLFNLIKLKNYSSTSTDNKLKDSNENAEAFNFEAPEIFKSGGQEDIVKTKEQREIGPKLEKPEVMDLPVDIDWPNKWPTAQTFDPNRVPLPLHQGAPRIAGEFRTRMNQWQNSELIKIPNFLHLTPKAVKNQTDAIKKFCTKWPKKLTKEKLEEIYPVTIYSQDRVHSSPSIRDPKARIIRLEIHIDKLKLDEHAKDKLIRLLEHRYDPKTGMIKIETTDCPFKDQNLDLSIYRLTACYFEAWKTEDWEIDKKD